MIINWYGEACFKIQSGEIVILTDPFESSIGLTPPRFKADVVLKSDVKQPSPYLPQAVPVLIGAGDYEIKGVEISGFSNKSSTIYVIKIEDMKLGFLGHLTETLEPAALERIGEADIIFVPAGGKPFIDQETAAKLIKKISPKLVIPSLFKTSGLKRKSDDLKEFLKEIGQKSEPQEKLTIKKKDLPAAVKIAALKV